MVVRMMAAVAAVVVMVIVVRNLLVDICGFSSVCLVALSRSSS